MTKRKSEAAGGAPASAPPNLRADVASMNGNLRYSDPKHFSRTIHPRAGGPWTEDVVAASIADQTLSKMLKDGYDLLFAKFVTAGPQGLAMVWMLAKPEGHAGNGWREIKHFYRTVGKNLGAAPDAITGYRADDSIAEFMADGWTVFNFERVSHDPSGQSWLWVLVR